MMEQNIKTDEMGRKFIYAETGVKVFVHYKDNLIVDPDDPLIANQARNMPFRGGIVKGLSCLGREDSEDALTWNVFRTLEKADPEKWFWKVFPPIVLGKDEQFLWPIFRFWEKYFPPIFRSIPEQRTHADITMETSDKLIFIEVKYKSDISQSTTHDSGRDQIIRNIDVGSWAAKKRAKAFCFVLLTLKTNTYSIDKLNDYKSNPSRIIDKIGSYRKDIQDYAALCQNIHVICWDQILNALQNIQSVDKAESNFTRLIDYLEDKLAG